MKECRQLGWKPTGGSFAMAADTAPRVPCDVKNFPALEIAAEIGLSIKCGSKSISGMIESQRCQSEARAVMRR